MTLVSVQFSRLEQRVSSKVVFGLLPRWLNANQIPGMDEDRQFDTLPY